MSDTNPPKPPAGKLPVNRRRRWVFRLVAILLAFLPFVLLEAGLRIFDVGRPTEYDDPFVGFSDLHPQFELQENSGKYVTTLSRRVPFNLQEFSAKKPKNGFRAFCLGGSTVNGRPYSFETAFPQWMQLELAASDPEKQYEIINCGGISYASYRLKPLLKEVLQYQPDLIVIATGHNEFLEDRTYQEIKKRSAARQWIEEKLYSLRTVTLARRLWDSREDKTATERTLLPEKLDTRLDHPSGYASYHRDEQWRRDIAAHFNLSLRAMIAMCREADVPVILVRLGSNLRDCPPFKSEHKAGLSESAEQEWQRHFDQATAAEETDIEKALATYRKAERIDGKHALLCFRIARCLDRLSQHDEAERYYIMAKEEDVCPLRLIEPMSENIETIATETNTPMIDARSLLEQQTPHGIPGNDFYLDHVHPTIAGHQLIARAIVQRLRREEWGADPEKTITPKQRRATFRRQFDNLGLQYLRKGNTRIGWLEGWASRERLLKETYPVDHRGRMRYGSRLWDLGQQNGAWTFLEAGIKEAPTPSIDFLLDRALALFQSGRAAESRSMLERMRPLTQGQQRDRVDLALLALAVDRNDVPTVMSVLRESGSRLATLDDTHSAWLKVMSDLLSRAQRIADR